MDQTSGHTLLSLSFALVAVADLCLGVDEVMVSSLHYRGLHIIPHASDRFSRLEYSEG